MISSLLIRYIIALTNLYGIVHKELICEIFNRQNSQPVSLSQVEAMLKDPPPALDEGFVVSYGDFFVSSSVLEFDDFDELLAQKSDKPYYRPDKSELLKYADNDYIEENESYQTLLNYIKNNFYKGDALKSQMLAKDIQGLCQNDGDIDIFLGEFSRRKLRFKNEQQRQEVVRLIEDLADHTRFWVNNGHTPLEMEEIFDETINGIIFKLNLDHAVLSEPVHDHRSILGFRLVSDLRETAKLLNIKNYSKMKKQALINEIVDSLSHLQVLEFLLNIVNSQIWEFFLTAVKTDVLMEDHPLPDHYMSLQQLGLVQLFYNNDQFSLVVPDIIKKNFTLLEDSGFIQKKHLHDDLTIFSQASVNLYGVIHMTELIRLFNQMFTWQTDVDQARAILDPQASAEVEFFFWEDCLVSSVFSESDISEIAELEIAQQGKLRYVPPYEEFLLYSDSDYYEETPQIKALETYLDHIFDDEDEIMEIVDSIHELCMEEASPQEIFEFLADNDVDFEDMSVVKKLVQLVFDVQNSTRLWANNGFTPNELRDMSRPKVLQFPVGGRAATAKVGRNDPCPCGSGKKYKNCCGK